MTTLVVAMYAVLFIFCLILEGDILPRQAAIAVACSSYTGFVPRMSPSNMKQDMKSTVEHMFSCLNFEGCVIYIRKG